MAGPSKKKKSINEMIDQKLDGLSDEEKKGFQMMALQSGFRAAAPPPSASGSKTADADDLEKTIEELKSIRKDLEKAKKENEKLSKEADKNREAAEKYKPYKERFEKKNEEHKALQAECEELKQSNSALRQANEQLNKDIKSMSKPQREVPADVKKELEEEQKKNRKLSSELSALQDEKSDLEADAEAKARDLADARDRIASLQAELDASSGKRDLMGTVSRPEPTVLVSDLFTKRRYKAVISRDGTKITFTPDIEGGAVCENGRICLPKLESYVDFDGAIEYKAYSADGEAIVIWI